MRSYRLQIHAMKTSSRWSLRERCFKAREGVPNTTILVPSVGMFASPVTDGAINAQWASYVLDALDAYTPLLDDADEWQLLINRLINGAWGVDTTIGTISMIARASIIPAKWMECDGRALSRTTYAALFAACDVAYGNGNGTTTFNIPDMKGRYPIGRGALGDVNGDEGDYYGNVLHFLTLSQIPAHTHSIGFRRQNGTAGTLQTYGDNGTAGAVSTGSAGSGTGIRIEPPTMTTAFMIYVGQ